MVQDKVLLLSDITDFYNEIYGLQLVKRNRIRLQV